MDVRKDTRPYAFFVQPKKAWAWERGYVIMWGFIATSIHLSQTVLNCCK